MRAVGRGTIWNRWCAMNYFVAHAKEVTVLDVRPEDEFVLGHLPGAINIHRVP
jgi:rhodanese-related sulfurtransferase